MIPRIMLDLETLGNKPGSVILSIGAVKFGGGQILEEFYARIDPATCTEAGLIIDAPTVLWWFGQPDAARLEFAPPWLSLRDALESFAKFHGPRMPKGVLETEMWGMASFDTVVLGAAYAALRIKQPWHYAMDRCYRTIREMNPQVPYIRSGTIHNALQDAKDEAIHLMQILGELPKPTLQIPVVGL